MQVKRPPVKWDPPAAPSFWINHASRLIMREFEKQLRPLDMGFAYVPVIMALEEAGQPLLQKDLAEHAHVEQPTMAALLARMERDGLIQREPHPTDRRASLISLTPKCRERIPQARELLRGIADQAVAGFSDDEKTQVLALLQRVVQNMSSGGTLG